MTDEHQPSLWAKVDYSLVAAPESAEADGGEIGSADWRASWRWRRRLLDAVSTLVWSYAVLKVFIANVDSDLIGGAAQYRFFFFLALALGLVIVLRRRWPILAGFSYVLGFPLIVLCWKLPKAIGKTRSTVAFLAAANALTLLLSDIKTSIITASLAGFAALAIALSHPRAVLMLAAILMLVLVVYAMFRTIKTSVRPSAFLRMQQLVIRKMVASEGLRKFITPNADLRSVNLERFNQEQQAAFIQSLGQAVLTHRLLSYWAFQLERYRRSAASLFYNGLAYFWLILRTLLGLAFINDALFHGDPTAFAFRSAPSFPVFVRYAIAGFYGGEISALQARTTLADALSILAFVLGLVVVGSLVLSSALTYRAARDESDLRETIAEIKRENGVLARQMHREYDVTISEAIERLEQLKFALLGVIRFFSARIPPELDDDGGT